MSTSEMNKEGLRAAIRFLKSQSELARICSRVRTDGGTVRQGHVYWWLNSPTSHGLPAEYVLEVEAEILKKGGTISRHHLRCDVFGPPATSASAHATEEVPA